MYKDNSRLRIEDFVFPYGKLDPANDWVKLATLAPWDVVEERYAAQFSNNARMYRKRARKDYLRLSKSKKRTAKAVHSAVRKQLQYIRRDVGYVTKLIQNGAKLSQKQADRLNVATTVYEQQRLMFESGIHSIPRRIVSLAQPRVRPIVRGKAHANTEFGAKLHVSLVDGYPTGAIL